MTDSDREEYLALLAGAERRYGWRCLSYCLMDNHVHLLIETPEPNLGVGMQWMHSLYVFNFNQRYGRVGHLFQTRYGSSRIRTDDRLEEVREYIAMNPVKAGLCRAPADWPWSNDGPPAL